jgi:hypothetical protein
MGAPMTRLRFAFRVLPGERVGDVMRGTRQLPPSHELFERAQYHRRQAEIFEKLGEWSLQLELEESVNAPKGDT